MPCADPHATVVIERFQKIHDIIVIVKRLSGPHHNNMGQPLAGLVELALHVHELGHHFAAGQVPFFLGQTAGAEGASHIASDLTGNTDAFSVVEMHEDAFKQRSVFGLEKKLCRSVAGYLLPDKLERIDDKVFLEQLAGFLGQIAHFVERGGPLAVKPLKNLMPTKGFPSAGLGKFLHLIIIQIINTLHTFHSPFVHSHFRIVS